ncbi:hypothetical protein ACGFZ6_14245 [Stutzerimonas stutzeri]|uniref:hypothetical protein n=1 Tax=Stutzerimonas stutzeri TaxID=316 RepID=UPI0037125500
MSEKLDTKEIHEPIDIKASINEDNQVIADAIENLAAEPPSSSGVESLLQNQNEILSSLVELVRISTQPDYIPYLVAFASLIISIIALYLSH